MKFSAIQPTLALLWCALAAGNREGMAAVNVTQHHNHATRDGLYIDPAITQTAAASLTRDLGFDGTIAGNVYAQPLYIEGGPSGKGMLLIVTESDNVYALDALDGSVIWPLTAPSSGMFTHNRFISTAVQEAKR